MAVAAGEGGDGEDRVGREPGDVVPFLVEQLAEGEVAVLVEHVGRGEREAFAVLGEGGLIDEECEDREGADEDGPGVPEADRDRVFERFARLDDSRTRTSGGSGLGLAIVGEIVADHRETVTVTRSPSLGGACFIVTLPDARTIATP